MKKLILVLLVLTACKKEPVDPEPSKTKQFRWEGTGVFTKDVSLNGSQKQPPFNVVKGDLVYVNFSCQTSTPQKYDLRVKFFVDNQIIGSCLGCYTYTQNFTIE